jgi:dTDP-4-dehydrorhamnose reductase
MGPLQTVVFGAAGQLGGELCRCLAGDVVALTRADADLTQPDAVRSALDRIRPGVVINCAAYNFVDRAESEPHAAFAVNGWAVRDLARACRDLGCILVHFSSDYVFGLDEQRRTPYAESDAPGPLNVYGLSKLAGEYLVRATTPKHFVIRTCGLYGAGGSGGKGGNFVETMLRLAGEDRPLRVVADQTCTPSYTVDVARATAALIQTGRHGVYHLTNGGGCSWHEFARAIFEAAGVKAEVTPITSEQFGAAARRPAYSVLAMRAYEGLGLPPLAPWREALGRYLQERQLHRGKSGEQVASAPRCDP